MAATCSLGDAASQRSGCTVGIAELRLHGAAPVGGAMEAAHVPQRRVGHDGPEAVGVPGDPVGHVAAERAAHGGRPGGVDVRPGDHVVHDRHQVGVRLLAPSPPAAAHEVDAVARRQARVGQHHRVSPVDQEVRVPAPVPGVPGAQGTAVDPEHHRCGCPGRCVAGRDEPDPIWVPSASRVTIRSGVPGSRSSVHRRHR